ncbi:nucleosome assembly protein 1-like 1 isoform X1 [Pecten maximus]|uniref:nucleosome assembly protein 1-like 1 isoform X1 n=1 Tax=Pecten maximus TaxID=6579 RepID=UPI001457F55F|nr:nucleosome assembly protein 1-like 1 isoform X1 [Pecten maximus]
MADAEGKATEAVEDVDEVEEVEEEEGGDVVNVSPPGLVGLLKSPQVLAAVQERLDFLQGAPSGYIQSLPKSVKRRIKALKKLQFEAAKIEAEFYKEVHDLECKYASLYTPLFDKRKDVVTAAKEPTDEECDWPSDDEKEEKDDVKLAEDVKNKIKIDDAEKAEEKTDNEGADVKGIPGFWLTVFKNVEMLSEMIQDHDEPILNCLQDVKVKFSEVESTMGFVLEFYFETNDFFTNTVLTKHYTMKSEPDETDPFSFEGPEIVKCEGCQIDWKKGKNVTVKTIKKKQKHKGRGTTRTVTKTVQNDSFFNFFSPPTVPEGEEEDMDEDLEALLAADFEIGHFIRDRIVPRAVLYFTGEALENDDDFDEEGEEEDGEDGEYDEDADPDYNPQSDSQKPEECKQQ